MTLWGRWSIAAAGLVCLLALVISWWGLRSHNWSRRLILGTLRALVVVVIFVLVLQPSLRQRSLTRGRNRIALLIDRSNSMGVIEKTGSPSRLVQAKRLLQRSTAQLSAWRRERTIDTYVLDERLRPGRIKELSLAPPAHLTRIGAAIASLDQRYAAGQLAAVVLLSDGAETDDAATAIGLPGVPIHTALVGSRSVRDVSIRELYADEFAFVRNALTVEADIVASGLSRRKISVALFRGQRLLQRKALRLEQGQSSYRVRFTFVPQQVGTQAYSISSPVLSGEALEQNNRRTFLLRVIRDRIRVLQICGRPSWDQRFLRRLLKRDPNTDLISFFILRTPASLSLVPPSELSLIPFPTEELFERQLGSFDLVILQNFSYRPFGIGSYLPQLRSFVEQGGGLAMTGGDLSFSSGGYHGTELAAVLPVRLLPAKQVQAAQLVSTARFRPVLTPAGRTHPIMRLSGTPEGNRRFFARAPSLTGLNIVAGAKASALVLARHPKLRDPQGMRLPVLAVQQIRKGRSLALMTDGIWRWAFHAQRQGVDRRNFDRFWQNAVRWLIRDPELSYLRVAVDRPRTRPGQALEVSLRALGLAYRPAPGVTVDYQVVPLAEPQEGARGKPGGAVRAVQGRGVTNAAGEITRRLQLRTPGAYRIEARANIAGRENRAATYVLVRGDSRELRDVRADPAFLRRLSARSGGRYLGRVQTLPESLPFNAPQLLRVNWERTEQLWSRWWSLSVVLGLLSLEWAVRRRFGHA